MKGLNLSKFKKVHDSDDHAVFRNDEGSEIKVAKAGLSANRRKELEALPVHRAEGTPYDMGLPCKNPNCKSHGKPHPNCMCYGFAEGGSVQSACARGMKHERGCKYYAEGTPDSVQSDDSNTQAPASLQQNDPSVQTGVPGISINIHAPTGGGSQDQTDSYQQDPGYQKLVEDYRGKIAPGSAQERVMGTPEELAKKDWDYDQAYKKDPGSFSVASASRAKGIEGIMNPPAQAMQTTQGPKVASMTPMAGLTAPLDQPTSEQIQPPSQAPIQAPNQAPAHPALAYKQQVHQDMMQEDQKFQHDLDHGYIKPQTYRDLFAKKDTLGKIGTIFGLIVSGMGSGLTHQPNALLGMMNNEIQNDLEAQKATAGNRYNLMHLAQQSVLNQAQIKSMNAETAIKSQTFANMMANRAALHHLVTMSQSFPQGSQQRQQADQTLAMISPLVNTENYNLADAASARMAMMNGGMGMMGGQSQSGSDVDFNRMNHLEFASQMKMPGAPTSEDLQNMTKEAQHLQEARALRNDFNNAFEALDGQFMAGKFSPRQRDSYVNSLAGKLAKVSAGRYNAAEAKNQIESMIPQLGEWGGTRDVKRQNNNRFFDIEEAGTPTLERFGVKRPAQVPHGTSPNVQPVERMTKDGKTALFDPNSKKFLGYK